MHAVRSDTPEGFRGTARTLAAMHLLSKAGAGDLAVRNLAARIVAGCRRRDYAGEAACLLAWVQGNVRYVRDPAIPGDGLERVQDPRVTLFEMPHGDCVPGRTLLLTEGLTTKSMEEIRIGDRVISRDGDVGEVTQKWHKGKKRCLYFMLNNGSVLPLTPDHRVFVEREDGVAEVRAEELRVGSILVRGGPREKHSTGVYDQDRVDFFRLCGYYAADGWYGDENRVGIAGKDGGPKEAQKDWIVSYCQKKGIKYRRHPRYVMINDRTMAACLSEECGRLARGKRIPLSPDMTREELQALYDGLMADSGIQKNVRCYSTCSPSLAIQARLLMHLLGFPCTITEVVNHGGFGRDPIYRVYENRRRPKKIKVKEIHEGNIEDVYDIETTTGSFYLPESDVVVHNCDDLSVALAAMWASIGGTYAFRTVGDGPDPDDFRHVYVMLLLHPSGWTPADPSFEEPLGWEPSQAVASILRDGTQLARVTQVRDWPA